MNDRFDTSICRFVRPQDRPVELAMVRMRRVPLWALQAGTNTLKLTRVPYPVPGDGQLRPLWVGSLGLLVERTRSPVPSASPAR